MATARRPLFVRRGLVAALVAAIVAVAPAPVRAADQGPVLSGFRMDVDGDGTIDLRREVFDLIVVAGGRDGTVQFFRLDPGSTTPVLISVVRLSGEATSVVLDRDENLAYVSAGARGLVMIDLAGPASIQPIDQDRDGVDDRVLGTADSPASASATALSLARGAAFLADGNGGVAVAQLIPPRARFLAIARDPVKALDGEEQTIGATSAAFTTDDAVRVEVQAVLPAGESLVLTLEDVPPSGGSPLLAFEDGGTASPLEGGVRAFSLNLATGEIQTAATVSLRIRHSSGHVLATMPLRIEPPDDGGSNLEAVRVAPEAATISADQSQVAFSVAGFFASGLVLNLTRPETGTTYRTLDPVVASVDAGGRANPLAGGKTRVVATNLGVQGAAQLSVDRPPVLVALVATDPTITLRAPGSTQPTNLVARLSNGATLPAGSVPGTAFSTSDPAVVEVAPSGFATAVGEGEAHVAATNGALTAQIHVRSEFRRPASLAAIQLELPAEPVQAATVGVGARILGAGSLDGLTVRFSFSGLQSGDVQAVTTLDGSASAEIAVPVEGGLLRVTTSVTDPASGELRTASGQVVLLRPALDAEPNDSPAAAVSVPLVGELRGGLDPAAGDGRDVFRLETGVSGTVTARVSLAEEVVSGGLDLVMRDEQGLEVARFRATSDLLEVPLTVVGGGALFLSLEGVGGRLNYELELEFSQDAVAIAGVSPLSGPVGTLVTVEGTGFGTNPDEVTVAFGRVPGRLVSVTPTRVQALVPALAPNGPIAVSVASRSADGPVFATGLATPPPVFVEDVRADSIVRDPVSGEYTVTNRLSLDADPLTPRSAVESLISPHGGRIVGLLPALNRYVVQFDANRSLSGLLDRLRAIGSSPLIREVSLESFDRFADTVTDIERFADASDRNAWEQMKFFEAVAAARATPPFDEASRLRPVRVAIIDDGFAPGASAQQFENAAGRAVVQFRAGNSGFQEDTSTGGLGLFHGTPIASIIAALNDGLLPNGLLNGLLNPGERPFEVHLYALPSPSPGSFSVNQALAAVTAVAGSYDVVNLSFGSEKVSKAARDKHAGDYRDAMRANGGAGKTLYVVSAGNSGIDAKISSPCLLARTKQNVVCVGGVATASNSDLTGEKADARSNLGGGATAPLGANFCDAGITNEASNCGSTVTIAAPGEDIVVIEQGGGLKQFRATSAAAPMLAGVAAMVQALRPTPAPIAPGDLRALLVRTADDIDARWKPGGMKRVNALRAVREVLSAYRERRVYVADEGEDGHTPRVVGIDVDPITGDLDTTEAGVDVIVPDAPFEGQTIAVSRVLGLAVSPSHPVVFAVAEANAQVGGGIVVINTHTLKAVSFLPFSSATASNQASTVGTLRPAMTFSRDGRLLYVAAGRRLFVVNVAGGARAAFVRRLADLPPPFNALARNLPVSTLSDRLEQLEASLGVNGSISALDVSPDGRTLYAAVRRGGGSGRQGGTVLPIDVDLYRDARESTPTLESDLGSYLKPAFPGVNVFASTEDDEPSDLAVGPDGSTVHVVSGGYQSFESIGPEDLNAGLYRNILAPSLYGVSPGAMANGGVGGLTSGVAAVQQEQGALFDELARGLKNEFSLGAQFINAPGATVAYTTAGAQQWFFPSEVVFGWAPSAAAGGRLVNQFSFRRLFAKRPFSIAFRPDGGRAIASYFQTGNFGVMDLDTQQSFGAAVRQAAPPGLLAGVAAVTPAVALSAHLWPSRGAFQDVGLLYVPSPDESLLFPSHVEYAQNGRFAVGIHAGNGPREEITAVLPDFQFDNDARLNLVSIGFQIEPGADSGRDPDGLPVFPRGTHAFQRGGGAITVLNDDAITNDLAVNAGRVVLGENGVDRPFFAQHPLCEEHDDQRPACSIELARSHYQYEVPSGGKRSFGQLRALAIDPFVQIESPRFGDYVRRTQSITVRWRDASVTRVRFTALDLGTSDVAPPAPPQVGQTARTLDARQKLGQTLSLGLTSLIAQPTDGHRYRIRTEVLIGSLVLSTSAVDVRFER